MKGYSTKANARRAAKSQGLDVDQLFFIENEDKLWTWETERRQAQPAEEPTRVEVSITVKTDSSENVPVEVNIENTTTGETLTENFIAEQEQIADKIANNAVLADPISPVGNIETFPHQSTISKPCKQVFHIADEMKAKDPEATRSEIINECVKRGIAFYTARTQYQQWFQVQKEMKEREANQARVKAGK